MLRLYTQVRGKTLDIVQPLKIEDYPIQSSPECSPVKWHLAHTSWFFERLLLEKLIENYKPFNEHFYRLFNSYYQSLESPWKRQNRGVLSRPTVAEVFEYRSYVDQLIIELLASPLSSWQQDLIRLGLEHEQQHQELLYMDIQHLLSLQEPAVAYFEKTPSEPVPGPLELKFKKFEGGLVEVGADSGIDFVYDNEQPRHQHYLRPFSLANRLITNFEYLEFMEAGGYQKPEYWHADGWAWVVENNIQAPLYWKKSPSGWQEFSLSGEQALKSGEPVSHISFYEASAYARYCGKRLPTEFEWESAVTELDIPLESYFGSLQKRSADSDFSDICGVLWQWTQSPYSPYPGHKWKEGPLGEYNSKFMINQMVLRGGCMATPSQHFRITYRNFFYPHQRWAFTGIRLAEGSE